MSSELHKKLSLVSLAVGAVAKDGIATAGGSYAYRKAEDLMAALHLALAKNGVSISPASMTADRQEGRTKTGTVQTSTLLKVQWRISCDGAEMMTEVYGEANDVSDKGIAKAITASWKSLVSYLFCIPTTDVTVDNETDNLPPASAASSLPI